MASTSPQLLGTQDTEHSAPPKSHPLTTHRDISPNARHRSDHAAPQAPASNPKRNERLSSASRHHPHTPLAPPRAGRARRRHPVPGVRRRGPAARASGLHAGARRAGRAADPRGRRGRRPRRAAAAAAGCARAAARPPRARRGRVAARAARVRGRVGGAAARAAGAARRGAAAAVVRGWPGPAAGGGRRGRGGLVCVLARFGGFGAAPRAGVRGGGSGEEWRGGGCCEERARVLGGGGCSGGVMACNGEWNVVCSLLCEVVMV